MPQSVCLEAVLQICSIRSTGKFIEDWTDTDDEVIEYVASQLDRLAVTYDRLLDTLKETALDTDILETFKSSAGREALLREVRDKRLLLCLCRLGTNAGLKRVAADIPANSNDELLHIRRRYFDPASLRAAMARVAEIVLAVRNTAIWGNARTACAAVSTKFGAWDRNLMTEWHASYVGRGVMICWHVAW